MSLQAYQQAATRAEGPRDTEFRLFAQVTRALVEATQLDPMDIGGRADALDWNRRVWAAFAADCGHPDNGLPKPLRASIISLSRRSAGCRLTGTCRWLCRSGPGCICYKAASAGRHKRALTAAVRLKIISIKSTT